MGFDFVHILLSVQIALLDRVSPNLRAVTVWFDENRKLLVFHFFYDAEMNDKLFDLASCATAEVDPDIGPYRINEDIVTRIDFPDRMPITGRLVYLRNEPGFEKYIQKKYRFEHEVSMVKLLLYVQQAMLGRVTKNLRMLSVRMDEKMRMIEFYFTYDGVISDENKDMVNAIIQESSKSFTGYKVNKHLKRVDYPEDISEYGQRIAYSRYEKR